MSTTAVRATVTAPASDRSSEEGCHLQLMR